MKAMKFNEQGTVPILLILFAVLLLGFLVLTSVLPLKDKLLGSIFPKSNSFASSAFLSNFDGLPSTPQAFLDSPDSTNWDVAVHSRDIKNWLQLTPFEAHHGPDCAPPIDAAGQLVVHRNNGDYHSAVFKCKDHLMTTIRAGLHGAPDEATAQPGEVDGYAVIYLTPNQKVDFSNEEAVITWEMATLRTAGRDWVDVWLTPYEDNLQLPLNDHWPDLNGVPKRSIHMSMTSFNGFSVFTGEQINDFVGTDLNSCWWCTIEQAMTTSPQKRSIFELRLSKTHVKFSMPGGQVDVTGKPINNGQPLVWVDKEFDTPLDWSQGVLQLGHHSYNPSKECTYNPATPYKECYANTWHWDNVNISNATPFTIIKADRRYVSANVGTDNTMKVNFQAAAPANSKLRFSAIGKVEYSLDGGSTYLAAVRQPSSLSDITKLRPQHGSNYFFPIPQGTQSVTFRLSGEGWYTNNSYIAKDFAIWSESASVAPSPVPSVAPSPVPSPAASTAPQTPQFTMTGSVTPVTVTPGTAVNISVNVKSQTNATGIVDFEIYDQANNKVHQQAFQNESFVANITRTFTSTWQTAASTPGGQYYVKAGVFSNDWSTVHLWSDIEILTLSAAVSPSPVPSVKPGDIDGNGKVDIFDYNTLLTNFGKSGTNLLGDFDKNGKVDIFDFNNLLTNFGK